MKRFLQISAGVGISAAALWLTFRGKDLGAVWGAMRGADYRYLVPYFAGLVAIHLIRTVRWGILLEPVAKVPFRRLNAVSAVGFMALVLLPFRLGEFARPYLIAERPQLRVSAAMSSVAVERVVDGIFMAVVLMVALLGVPGGNADPTGLRVSGVVVFLFFAALLVFLVVSYRSPDRAVRITHRMLDPISPRLAERLSGMVHAFVHGLRQVPSRGKVVQFFVLTFVYWGINGWGLALLARGFGLDLGLVASATLLGALVAGVTIPAGPGMAGTFHGAGLVALRLFFSRGVVDTQGYAYIWVLWFAQITQQTLFGLVFLFSRHIQFGRILHAPAEVEREIEEEEGAYEQGQPTAQAENPEPGSR